MDIEAKMAELQERSRKEHDVRDLIVTKLAAAPLLTERPDFGGAHILGVDFTNPADAENIGVTGPAISCLAGAIVAKGARPVRVWRGIYDGRYSIDVAIAA